MRRFQRVRFTAAVVLVGTAAFVVSRYLTTKVSAAGQTPAFTLQFKRTGTDLTSGFSKTSTHVYALRSDGSVVQQNIITRPNEADPSITTSLLLPHAGKGILISHRLRRVSTQRLAPDHIGRLKQAAVVDSRCSHVANVVNGRLFMGTDKVLGVAVVKYESRTAETVSTVYFAPQLACSELKSTYSWLKNGAVVGVTTEEPISITIGEPDSRLFTVPVAYTESKPSEMRLELWKSLKPGQPAPECLRKPNERDDLRYAAQR